MSAAHGARRVRAEEKPVSKDGEFVVMSENRELIHRLLSSLTPVSRPTASRRRFQPEEQTRFRLAFIGLTFIYPELSPFEDSKVAFTSATLPRKHYSIIALSISKDFQPGNKSTPIFLSHQWESFASDRAPTAQLKPGLLFLERD